MFAEKITLWEKIENRKILIPHFIFQSAYSNFMTNIPLITTNQLYKWILQESHHAAQQKGLERSFGSMETK